MNLWQTCKNYWPLLCILLLGMILGLYQLDTLPGEMWGDATAHYKLALQVQSGHFFANYRYGGDGPIFTYLVVLLASIIGLSFYTLKFTSVMVYLGFILVMYFLAYALFKNKRIAYLSSFIATVSFWSLTFGRQPHARILVPLFIALTILFALKKKNELSGILLGLSMYTQASIWALPFVFYNRLKIFFIGLILTIPLIISFFSNRIGFFSNQSYFGEKLATTSHLSLFETMKVIASNSIANTLSFNFFGDKTFRINVPGSPHLDFISGIFFIVGFALLIFKTYKQKDKRLFQFLILPFFIIQIPSLLDIHNPNAQPNIGRMIGIIPFVFMSIAYGIDWVTITLFSKIHMSSHHRKVLTFIFFGILLASISTINITKYFLVYPLSLPNHNIPFAKIIATSIDTLPTNTNVIILGSGWGQWQQPEQYAIVYSLNKKHTLYFLPEFSNPQLLCQQIRLGSSQTIIFTSPTNIIAQNELGQCAVIKRIEIVRNNPIYDVAKEITVTPK